jgi:hypothetical protein
VWDADKMKNDKDKHNSDAMKRARMREARARMRRTRLTGHKADVRRGRHSDPVTQRRTKDYSTSQRSASA